MPLPPPPPSIRCFVANGTGSSALMSKIVLWLWAAVWLAAPLLAAASPGDGWTQRLQLTLDTTASGVAIQSPVSDVPVLVRLHTGNFPFLEARPDGADLRFFAADGRTALKHHIERFDSVNELAFVWVRVPSIAPGARTAALTLHAGNPQAAPAEDPRGSWDAAQALVLHFSDSAALPQDSSGNGRHASASTARANPSGLIGGALSFDGNAQLQVAERLGGGDGLTASLWLRLQETGDALLLAQGDGPGALRLSLRGGRLVAQVGGATATAPAALPTGSWQHVAVSAAPAGLVVYVGGQEVARAAGAAVPTTGPLTMGRGLRGDIDELQVATTVRSADWVRLAAQSQGQDARLVAVGGGEEEAAAPGYLMILLGAVTVDGWIVIALCGVMFVVSIWIMVSKALHVSRSARDNQRFLLDFDKLVASIDPQQSMVAEVAGEQPGGLAPPSGAGIAAAPYGRSPMYSLYLAGVTELQARFDTLRRQNRPLQLSPKTLDAIRATVDARFLREVQALNNRMVLLTIAIAGGPFLGLLGTVVGVMITFAAIAAAGDVNVNAIAPGIAAALVATVAGLAVAIPCLFGYNYLNSRIGELTADMQVFMDELSARFAERHGT
jgi:biopolymer transport protein ExbB